MAPSAPRRARSPAPRPPSPAPAPAAPVEKATIQRDPIRESFLYFALVSAAQPLLWIGFVILAVGELLTYFLIGRRWGRGRGATLRSGLSGELPVKFFDPDDPNLDWQWLRREYVDRGVPFVLRRSGSVSSAAPLSSVSPPPSAVADAFTTGDIRVAGIGYLGDVPGIDEIVNKLFPYTPRAYWPLWFLGRYSQGKAHIDLGPHTQNCYYLRTGSKDVILIPPEVTRNTKLVTGLDGMYIDGSEADGREYLSKLPYYHRVFLPPQSMLVFNNACAIHQFRNIQSADGTWPQALSIRMKHCASCEPRIWEHLIACKSMVKRFSGVAISMMLQVPKEDRAANYL